MPGVAIICYNLLETEILIWLIPSIRTGSMDENQANQLPRMPFFKELSDEPMEVVSGRLEVLDLDPKQTVFEEGDSGDCVYFII